LCNPKRADSEPRLDGYANVTAKLVTNVVRRFADPAPLTLQAGTTDLSRSAYANALDVDPT
jgi:hypothetical protein